MDEERQTGSIGMFDPETGERKTQTFSYTPAPPPGPMDQLPNLMRAMYTSLPVEDAERAVSAAIQFQGLRGYRRDLDSGTDATTALAKWGPLMFYQKPSVIAPMAKAFQKPAMSPYQQAQIELARQKLDIARRAAGQSKMPTEFKRDPTKEYITAGGALIPPVRPSPTELETVTETIPAVEGVPAVPPVPAKPLINILGVPIPFTGKAAVPGFPGVEARGERKITRKIPAKAQTEVKTAPLSDVTETEPGFPKVTSKAQYDALKPGTIYIGKDGKKYRKV